MEITEKDLMKAIRNSNLEFENKEEVKEFLEDEVQFYLEDLFGQVGVLDFLTDEDVENLYKKMEAVADEYWNTK